MPIYEYECAGCGAHHEFIQKFSEGPKRKCPSCGKLRLKKQISAAAFHLKGDGWYVTDFRDKGKGKGKADSAEGAGDSKPDAKTSDSKPSDSKSSDSKASDSKASDSKASDSKAGGRAKTDGGGSGGSSRAA